MQLYYQEFIAEIKFSAIIGGFYGEVINLNNNFQQDAIVFLATKKLDLLSAMQQAVAQYFEQLQVLELV